MLPSNTILHNRYRIIQQLGKGGMGAVYEAMDENLSCLVAVKETFATTEEQQSAFEREAKLLANLSHPALPRVMHHFAEGDGQFLVMQYIPGNDLAELLTLRERPFAPAKVLEWADHLLDALEELHSYKPPIIHRDIKPSNLKLTPRGRIILIDFGIAKGAVGQMTTVETDGSLGAYTPNYAPLEQAVRADRRWVDVLSITNAEAVEEILKKGTDARSDLYALGATLYHLMTGEIPADAPTRALLVWSGKPDRLRPANNVNPEISKQVAETLQHAMAINRNHRPANAAEMRKMLREASQAFAPVETEERARQSATEQALQRAEKDAAEAARHAGESHQLEEEEETELRGSSKVKRLSEDEPTHLPTEIQQAPSVGPTNLAPTVASPSGRVSQQVENSATTARRQHPVSTILSPYTPASSPSVGSLNRETAPIGSTLPQTRRLLHVVVGVSAIILVAALATAAYLIFRSQSSVNEGPSVSEAPKVRESTGIRYTPSGNEGTITGLIVYAGTPPGPYKIDTSQDPVCGQKNPNLTTEDNVIRNGRLANVFVYIKDGTTADGKNFSDLGWNVPLEPVTLDQNGCHFSPHVLGIQTTQQLKITNSDPTQHNIHFMPKTNPEWNQSQTNGGSALMHDFKIPEVVVPVKCNQHAWMRAYIAILRHPFFAVSREDGSFEIKGVPAGTYTLAAWHEGSARGTEQTKQIKVDARGSVTADFEFGGATVSGQKSLLEMMPALEVPMVGRH